MAGAHMLRRAASAIFVLIATLSVHAENSPTNLRLDINQPVERELGPGRSDVFDIQATRGQYLHAVALQMGVDVVLTVVDPAGRPVAVADSPNYELGPEPVSWVAEATGTFALKVTKSDRSFETGHYRIELSVSDLTTENDRSELLAEQEFHEGVRKERVGAKESLADELRLYQDAAAQWHKLSNSYEEALCLHRVATVRSNLGDNKKALEDYEQPLAMWRTMGDRGGESLTLSNMGVAHYALGEKDKALEFYTKALPLARAAKYRSMEVRILGNLATAYREMGQKQKAIDDYLDARAVYRQMSDRAGEADVSSDLGYLYNALKDNSNALMAYQASLQLYHALNHRPDEAATLYTIGSLYLSLQDNSSALEFYQQSLTLYRELKNRAAEAAALSSVGGVRYSQKDYPKALESYQGALSIYQSTSDSADEASVFYNLGNSYYAMQQPSNAVNCYAQALPLYRSVADRKGEANTHSRLGDSYSFMGDPATALDHYNQAVSLDRAVSEKHEETKSLLGMSLIYGQLGEQRKALVLEKEALDLARTIEDRDLEAYALTDLGLTYSELGDKQQALKVEQQALSVARSIHDQTVEGIVLRSLCGIYSDFDRYQDALQAGEQALKIFETIGDRGGEADALHNLNRVYSNLDDTKKALQAEEKALEIYRAIGRRQGEAWSLVSVGISKASNGEKKEAIQNYIKAQDLYLAMKNPSGQANILALTGITYSDLGENRKALEYFNQALVPIRALGDKNRESAALASIGGAYLALGERQKALDCYMQALPMAHAADDRWVEAIILSRLSQVFKSSRPELAVMFGKQAVNLIQSIRRDNRGLQEASRGSYENKVESYYRDLAGLLVADERFGEAEEVLNLLKDKEAADFIRRDSVTDQLRATTLLDTEKKTLDQYDRIVDKIVVLGKRKAELEAKRDEAGLSDSEMSEAEKVDGDLKIANIVLIRFFDQQQKTLAADSGVAKRVVEIKDAQNLQSTLQKLGPTVVAIYTIVMPDKYVAMLLTGGARKAYTTPIKEADLNEKIFAFRQKLQNPNSDPLPLAQELYRIIFPDSLRQDLDAAKIRTIMWSVDSTLRYIPFAALYDGKQYLVESFQQSLITPLSRENLTDEPSRKWAGIGFGVSEGASPLPSVPAELHSIFRETADSKAPVPGVVRLNGAFTRASFENDLRRRRNRVVHIATHFRSRPGVAASSELLLGDGPFSLADIEAESLLFDGVDLLTLSACNTAFTNKSEDGREIDSFGTIAQRLGAKGVIASLWSVDDSSTAMLMQTMYSLRQDGPGMTKTEALREAQAGMATGALLPAASVNQGRRGLMTDDAAGGATNKSGTWKHPYYWAPFILIGNWK